MSKIKAVENRPYDILLQHDFASLEKEIKAKAQDPVRQEAIRKLIEEYKDYSD